MDPSKLKNKARRTFKVGTSETAFKKKYLKYEGSHGRIE